jgi:5-methylcytosine-specific restriction endonuclease McrA
MLETIRCVVLNSTYRPVHVIPAKRALKMYFEGKVHIVEQHPTYMVRSVTASWPVPIIVALKKFIKERIGPAILTKRNLFIRDKYSCQYCGRSKSVFKSHEFLTVDHVVPQSYNGPNSWTNVVAACSTCNNNKGNTFLEKSGMHLLTTPSVPTIFEIWSKYLAKKYHLTV